MEDGYISLAPLLECTYLRVSGEFFGERRASRARKCDEIGGEVV